MVVDVKGDISFIFFLILFIYLFVSMQSLQCCTRAFSSCRELELLSSCPAACGIFPVVIQSLNRV